MKHEKIKKIFNSYILKFLGSVRFLIFLSIVITISLILGTVILQEAPKEQYMARYSEATYILFSFLKLTDIYHSGWFIVLVFLLFLNVLLCTLKRFSLRLTKLGSTLTHLGILIILIGAAVSAIGSERGFMGLREEESKDTFFIGHYPKKLGFKLYLRDFILERDYKGSSSFLEIHVKDKYIHMSFPIELDKEYIVTGSDYKIKILKIVPDFLIDIDTKEVITKSDNPNNPAIEVEITSPVQKRRQWVFAKFPDLKMGKDIDENLKLIYIHKEISGNVTDFRSRLAVIDNDEIVKTKTIEVNDPLHYKGYTFYQAEYNPDDLIWTGLQVVKDPGIPFVYTGFCVLIVGLIAVFYGKPFLNKIGTA